jgi:hypothetical protein
MIGNFAIRVKLGLLIMLDNSYFVSSLSVFVFGDIQSLCTECAKFCFRNLIYGPFLFGLTTVPATLISQL